MLQFIYHLCNMHSYYWSGMYLEEGGVILWRGWWRGWCGTLKRVVWYFKEGSMVLLKSVIWYFKEGGVVFWRGWCGIITFVNNICNMHSYYWTYGTASRRNGWWCTLQYHYGYGAQPNEIEIHSNPSTCGTLMDSFKVFMLHVQELLNEVNANTIHQSVIQHLQ